MPRSEDEAGDEWPEEATRSEPLSEDEWLIWAEAASVPTPRRAAPNSNGPGRGRPTPGTAPPRQDAHLPAHGQSPPLQHRRLENILAASPSSRRPDPTISGRPPRAAPPSCHSVAAVLGAPQCHRPQKCFTRPSIACCCVSSTGQRGMKVEEMGVRKIETLRKSAQRRTGGGESTRGRATGHTGVLSWAQMASGRRSINHKVGRNLHVEHGSTTSAHFPQ